MSAVIPFSNRTQAGKALGKLLLAQGTLPPDCLVLGLVRGGTVIAKELAAQCGLSWDIMLVRKLGAPTQPEYAVGAYAENGACQLNQVAMQELGLDNEWAALAQQRAERECTMLSDELRGGAAGLDLNGRTVILTDDGMATGLTMLTAVQSAKEGGASRIIAALPVLSQEGLVALKRLGIDCYYLACPDVFRAVGLFYRNFDPVTTSTVKRLLAQRSS